MFLYCDPIRPEVEEIIVRKQDRRDISKKEVMKVMKENEEWKFFEIDEIKTKHLKTLHETGLEKIAAVFNMIYIKLLISF